jgi:hypothetical protein
VGVARVGGRRADHYVAASTELLALAYADDPSTPDAAERVVAGVGDDTSVYAAYAWYCAGEAVLASDVDRARTRLVRAIELAELTGASFVTGVAGATLSSIDARLGDPLTAAADQRRLIRLWQRSGAWSTLWTLMRGVVALLVRLERYRDAAVLEGAVRSTASGHRIFGADAVALAELGRRVRAELGDEAYEAAVREGSTLDGERAVEHALRALEAPSRSASHPPSRPSAAARPSP